MAPYVSFQLHMILAGYEREIFAFESFLKMGFILPNSCTTIYIDFYNEDSCKLVTSNIKESFVHIFRYAFIEA